MQTFKDFRETASICLEPFDHKQYNHLSFEAFVLCFCDAFYVYFNTYEDAISALKMGDCNNEFCDALRAIDLT